MHLQEMTQEECIAVVSNGRLGNLACARDNRPYVVPIYYAYSESHLYSFSMPGQKIEWMRSNPHVCVQVDNFSDQTHWQSVVMHGLYHELPDIPGTKHDREHAWFLLQLLTRNAHLHAVRCRHCDSQYLRDRVNMCRRACPVCTLKRTDAERR